MPLWREGGKSRGGRPEGETKMVEAQSESVGSGHRGGALSPGSSRTVVDDEPTALRVDGDWHDEEGASWWNVIHRDEGEMS